MKTAMLAIAFLTILAFIQRKCDSLFAWHIQLFSDFEESFDPSLVYHLDFEPILAAEAVVLQWHTQVQNIDGKSFRQKAEEIYNECKNPAFNNSVLAHEFLNYYKFSQLLANTTRFTDKNPSNYIQNLIKFRR